jgi:hypothetical protein
MSQENNDVLFDSFMEILEELTQIKKNSNNQQNIIQKKISNDEETYEDKYFFPFITGEDIIN